MPAPVRDVAGRVLVEERVAEHKTGPLDRRRAVDQGDLAEEGRLPVGRELLTDDLGADAAVAATIRPPSSGPRDPDTSSSGDERPRRADEPSARRRNRAT